MESTALSRIGLAGLAVMGQNLALNTAEKGSPSPSTTAPPPRSMRPLLAPPTRVASPSRIRCSFPCQPSLRSLRPLSTSLSLALATSHQMENSDVSDPMLLNASDPAPSPTDPHAALFLVLGYLRLPDLLGFQSVCGLFREAIAGDRLLWMRITVEPSLSGRLTDDALLQFTSRAVGTLMSLALLDCWKITDAGLLQVVDRNPTITELYIPGCTYLTADGVVGVVQRLSEQKGKLKRLCLRGLCNISRDHLDSLNYYLGINDHPQCSKPSVYNHWMSLPHLQQRH